MQAGGSVKVKPPPNEWRTGPDDTLQVVNPKSKKVKVRQLIWDSFKSFAVHAHQMRFEMRL